MNKLGLRFKFILAVLLAQCLVLAVSAWNTSRVIAQKVQEAAASGTKNYAFLLNATLSSYARSGSIGEMNSFMSEMLKESESTLAFVAVNDSKGSQLMAAGDAAAKNVVSVQVSGATPILVELIDGEKVFVSRFALLLKDGEVGQAVFGLKIAEYESLRKSLVYQEMAAGMTGILIALILIHVLTRGLQSRIAALDKTSAAIAKGEIDKPFEIKGYDELDKLAQAFNSMQVEISAKMDDLSIASQMALASEARFRSLFEHAPVPMLLVSTELNDAHVVELVNQAFVDLLGYSRENLGNSWKTWPIWSHQVDFEWEDLCSRKMELSLLSVAKKDLVVEAAAAFLELSDGTKAVAVSFVDNTEKEKAAHELSMLNASLEERVKTRSAALMESNAELRSALEKVRVAQEQLVANEKLASLASLVAGVAHEMGTPIGNALLTSSALQEQTQKFESDALGGAVLKRSMLKEQAERTIEACKIIGQSLAAASHLLQSFKQLAVDRHKNARRVFLVESVARDTMASHDSRLRKARAIPAHIEIEKGLEIDGYPGALSQVISNCIANSIIHGFEGREGGQIHLRAKRDPSDEAMVIIEFEDDGVGMDETTRKRIFDPFFTTKMGKGGTGMGMNIVHTLVTGVMVGTVVAKSQLGQGAKIVIRIPSVAPDRHE